MKKAQPGLANVEGYEDAGKTGTADSNQSTVNTQRLRINTFASVFPSSKPEYVLVVMLDSPKGSPTYVYNYRNKRGSYTRHAV